MSLIILNLFAGAVCGILIKWKFCLEIASIIIVLFILLLKLTKKKCIYFFATFFLFAILSNFNYTINDTNFKGTLLVVEIKEKYIIVRNFHHKFIIYTTDQFNLYQSVYFEGNLELLETAQSSLVSSFNDYLYNKGIRYQLNFSKLDKLNKGDIFRNFIINCLESNLSNESQKMVDLLVLGNKNNDYELYNKISEIGLSHLFVISGLHLNIIYSFYKKIFKKSNEILLILFLLPYLYLLNFSIPICRAFFFLILSKVFKDSKLNNIDFLLLIALGFLILNYHVLFNYSFILSFTSNLIIQICLNFKNSEKWYFKKIIMPIIITIGLIPFLVMMNNQISVFSIVFIILFSTPVSFLFLLSLFTSIIKISDSLLCLMSKILNRTVDFCYSKNKILIFGNLKMYQVFLYFLIFGILLYFILIRHKKKIILLSFAILGFWTIHYYKQLLFGKEEVIFLNVGQGDSTLIIGSHDKYNVLIDTGGLKYSDVAKTKIIPLLKAKGIKNIDTVILTHEDFDHCGALESLCSNYNVDNVIWSENLYSENINGFYIQNLNHFFTNQDNSNTKSGVLYFTNANKKYLIMGDAPKQIEEKIIDKYDISVDVLRVGHHGSKTSTSSELISHLKPQFAIISVGKNYYGHPNTEVLNILKTANIYYYRTDLDNNICFNKTDIITNY